MATTVEDVEKRLRETYPEEELLVAVVPRNQRSRPEREEYIHFRASEVVWMETTGSRRVLLHLMDGGVAVLPGELWRALRWFQQRGYHFVRTHRQVATRVDRVDGIEQA